MQCLKNHENLLQFNPSIKFSLRSVKKIKMEYKTDNNFAYKYELCKIEPTTENIKSLENDMKMYNFVPTYDKWCLYCDNKDAKKKCACHSVYFCNKECQQKAWFIHKNHCKRNLFTICILCGNPNPKIKCDKCPVKFCDDQCKQKIIKPHIDIDCEHFQKNFN